MKNKRLATVFRVSIVAAAVFACFFVPADASGTKSASMAADSKQPLFAPGGFQLQASNGYSLAAVAAPARNGHPAAIDLFVTAEHQGVIYSAPAVVTETSIQASLGELGEISVVFQPSGKAKTLHSKCGGKSVSIDSGSYEGKIEFRGEEGYTEVQATSAPGDVSFLLNLLCSGSGRAYGSSLRGAELHVRNPQLGPELTVIKNRSAAPARFEASNSEYRNGISIQRFTTVTAPGGAFRYDHNLQTATLHPPAPFSGTGHFDHRAKAGGRWTGDLTVDMPGRTAVPLTGPAFRANLVHAQWGIGGK